MRILAQLLTNITGHVRVKHHAIWRGDSLVHNAFTLWKVIFGARHGVRAENSVSLVNGVVTYRYHTWEALLFAIEESILHPRWIRVPVRITIPMFQTPIGQIPASPYLFAIAFDVYQGGTGTNPSLSITRGTGASNYIGVVDLADLTGTSTSSGSTWGGSSMTSIYSFPFTVGAGGRYYGRYFLAPGTGATTVASTTTGNMSQDTWVFSGVSQSAPVDPDFGGAGVNFKTNEVVGNVTVTGTTHADNSWLVGGFYFSGGTPAGGTNTTVQSSLTGYRSTAVVTPAGSASLILTGLVGASGGAVFALQPATAAGPANWKTQDTIVVATNLKTWNTVPLSNIKTINTIT